MMVSSSRAHPTAATLTSSFWCCCLAVCSGRCQNGGTCSGPETCSCPSGFTGQFCENDINECAEEKPCDQLCINTMGSYLCKCREGFTLQSDQQSCKKIGKFLTLFFYRKL